ncbi:MAG: hypothetical protein ACK56W_13305 [Pirellula sp.]|jgi:hypothetical protein
MLPMTPVNLITFGTWSIEPRIPMPLWWGIVFVSIAVLAMYWARPSLSLSVWQRTLFTILFGVGLVGPLLIALNPTWVEELPPFAGKPSLLVLIDQSMSMDIADVPSLPDATRLAAAQKLTSAIQSTETVDVEKGVFDEELRSAESMTMDIGVNDSNQVVQRGHRTDIATTIRDVIRGSTGEGNRGILLVSDGAHNASTIESVLSAAMESRAMNCPIYTITLGQDVAARNLSIAARNPRMITYAGLPVSLKCKIGHSGLEGESTQISVMLNNEIVQTRTVRLTDESNQEIRFVYNKPLPDALTRFEIVASGIEGEATESDNRTSITVQRLDEPIGCLLLEGKPYWDSKFLSANLGTNRVMQLTSMVKVGPNRFLRKRYPRPEMPKPSVNPSADNSDAHPSELEGPLASEMEATDWLMLEQAESPLESMELLEKFRVIVLGRDAEVYLSENGLNNLVEWLATKGGCLVCARGEPAQRVSKNFEKMLPVNWANGGEERIRARMSRYGFDSAVFDSLGEQPSEVLAMMPSLATAGSPVVRPGLPQVLLQSTSDGVNKPTPIVTYQPIGNGTSVVVEGSGMWRWAFLPPEHSDKEKVYSTLWQSLVQWIVSQQDLLPGQRVSLRPDKAAFLTGDKITASVLVSNVDDFLSTSNELSLAVILESQDSVLPKRFSLTATEESSDLFRVDMGTLEVGYYTAKVMDTTSDQVLAESSVEVRDPWFERLEADARPDVMQRIAVMSGGEVIRDDQISSLVDRFEQRVLENSPAEVKRSSIWDRPLVLLSILMIWFVSWVVRRRSGTI